MTSPVRPAPEVTGPVPPLVLISNSLFPDRVGGLERYVTELGDRAAALGVETHFIVRRTADGQPSVETRPSGAVVHRMAAPARSSRLYALRYPLSSLFSVRQTLAEMPEDAVVHTHFAIQALPLAIGRTPFLHTFHGTLHKEIVEERDAAVSMRPALWRLAVRVVRAVEARVLRSASRVLVLSSFMGTETEAIRPGTREKLSVLAGGVDTDWFTPGPASVAPSADGPASPHIVCARRLVPRMGVLELVEAMPAVLAAFPGARLDVAGDGTLRAPIAARIAELGLGDRVRLRGSMGQAELRDLYRAADLAVMPTQRREGFGLAAVEAMACGTPVIVTPAGALPEVLRPVDPRLIAAGISPAEIAAAVVATLRRDDLDDLGARCRTVTEERFSWDAVVDAHLELYRVAAARRARRTRRAPRASAAQADRS